MRRLVPIAIVLAIVTALFVLLRPKGTAEIGDDVPEAARRDAKAPVAVEGPARMPGGAAPREPARPLAPVTDESAGDAEPRVEGTVVDDETGKPVPGAWIEIARARLNCPGAVDDAILEEGSAPREETRPIPGVTEGPGARWVSTFPSAMRSFARSDADGRFSSALSDALPRVSRVDLVARKKGWIVGAACNADPAAPITVRLRRGLSIEGVVVTPDGKPIAGATIDATPPKGTPPPVLPGRRERATSDAEGKFAVEGLVEGTLKLVASHVKFIAESIEEVAAGKKGVRFVLRPAFFVSFTITTEDGAVPDSPTVEWKVAGSPPWGALAMLAPPRSIDLRGPDATEQGLRDALATYAPIVIPAGRPTATFIVKSLGYEPWTSEPIEIPAEGGATTLTVPLRRDPTVGRAAIALEDRDHRPLSFVAEKCSLALGRRDGRAVAAGVVYRTGEKVELPSLEAGPWRFQIRSPSHAPATIDLDVVAGRDAEGLAVLGPPARVRVRFTAPEAMIVKFRLLQGREPAWPFVEGATDPAEADGGEERALASGAEGVVLTGLAGGRYSFEILNPELTVPPTSVDLVEGETREVEIAVARR